jgi:acetylornithine deacetylase/succinyl-diaminopimelate desuccinylase-like protein
MMVNHVQNPTHDPLRQGRRAAAAAAILLATVVSARAAERLSAAHASIEAATAGRHVAALADDAFEGREGGSRGGRAAGAYIMDALAKAGLEPAGDGGGYGQQFGGMRNILALLRGRDPQLASEVVVVGAHYDHVGYGNQGNSYGPFGFVHNGADDNASGVAGLLELAEALGHLPERPRRSILVAFWDGEEKGLLGSRHFLRVRPAPLVESRFVFSVNLDMIGRLRDRRLEVYGTRSARGLRSAVVAANVDPGHAAGLELVYNWDVTDDSDHYPFIAAGIPTLMFHTGLHDQYHRPSDDAHLVNLDGIEPVVRLSLGIVTAVADEAGAAPAFRPECRTESDATRRALEAPAIAAGGSRGRWGIGTRADSCEADAPVVVRVSADSPAAKAGMLPGDRLLTVGGTKVADQSAMIDMLRAAGATVDVEVERRGRILRLEMRTEEAR